jgi:hypothetical protein
MAEKSISKLEANAAAVAAKALAEPLKAAIEVLNLATKVQANDVPEKLTNARRVKLLLLQRIQNDLRCCMILAQLGYPVQAVTQAATVYEAWATIANIETEEDAVKWLSHDKEYESFGRIGVLTKQAVKNITGDVSSADKMYSQYQQLCMCKHLNPIIERNRGYDALEGNVIQYRPGPDTSDLAIKWSWLALECASRFAHFALFGIAHSHNLTSTALHLELIGQQKRLNALQAKSAKRWPDNYQSQTYPDCVT